MQQEYRDKIIQLVNAISDERDLWLIMRFAQLRTEKK